MGNGEMLTLRKAIAEALEDDSLDLREISKRFRIKEKEALDHLEHVARSVRPKRFIMEPAVCLDCEFIFKKRGRLSTPSRCPLCRSSSVSPPRFKIMAPAKGIAHRA
jgi:predicted Zn-ribbon and HTH transcriptional regulator